MTFCLLGQKKPPATTSSIKSRQNLADQLVKRYPCLREGEADYSESSDSSFCNLPPNHANLHNQTDYSSTGRSLPSSILTETIQPIAQDLERAVNVMTHEDECHALAKEAVGLVQQDQPAEASVDVVVGQLQSESVEMLEEAGTSTDMDRPTYTLEETSLRTIKSAAALSRKKLRISTTETGTILPQNVPDRSTETMASVQKMSDIMDESGMQERIEISSGGGPAREENEGEAVGIETGGATSEAEADVVSGDPSLVHRPVSPSHMITTGYSGADAGSTEDGSEGEAEDEGHDAATELETALLNEQETQDAAPST